MEECIFCKIIKKELPAKFEYQDDEVVVIYDIAPKAPVHLLVIPKEHVAQVSDLANHHQDVVGKMFLMARDLAKKLGINQGYRLVVNNGPDSGQIVPHIHMHILGGWSKSHPDF